MLSKHSMGSGGIVLHSSSLKGSFICQKQKLLFTQGTWGVCRFSTQLTPPSCICRSEASLLWHGQEGARRHGAARGVRSLCSPGTGGTASPATTSGCGPDKCAHHSVQPLVPHVLSDFEATDDAVAFLHIGNRFGEKVHIPPLLSPQHSSKS